MLQEMQVRPVGSTSAYPVDVRVIAATNRNLEQAMLEDSFRQDLFYRLNVVRVTLPPLRERREDISALVTHFLRRFNRRFHRDVRGITPGRAGRARRLRLPRQRPRAREPDRARLCHGRPRPDHARRSAEPRPARAVGLPSTSNRALPTLADVEKELILRALSMLDNDKEAAARALGISRRTIYRRLKEYGKL